MGAVRTRVARNKWPHGVNAGAVGAVFGVTRQAVEAWVKEGCPKKGDGSFDLALVVKWRIARERGDAVRGRDRELLAEEQENTPALERFREARAALAEMELGEALGLLVRREAVEAQVMRVVVGFRQQLEGWPATLGGQLSGVDAVEAAGVLRVAVNDALAGLEAGLGEV